MSGIRHVVSVSGGQDSTVTLLIALERFGRGAVLPIFCDTGNEHDEVYRYLDYLDSRLGVSIQRLRADFTADIARKRAFIAGDQRVGRDAKGRRIRWTNRAKREALEILHPTGVPFLDLCLLKGRFPSRAAQFCTQELKRNIAIGYQLDLVDSGYTVVSWQGIRRDESLRRRQASRIERLDRRLFIFRPIVDWAKKEVFDFCKSRDIEHNPLYRCGMNRVGCMPCINSGKLEIAEIARRWPEHIDRILRWERLVSLASKRRCSTFFHKQLGGLKHTRDYFLAENVAATVAWARTTRGGKQYDLFAALADAESDGCRSSWGLCEA